MVAPFTGAWIEISMQGLFQELSKSLPSRERGLKSARSGVRVNSLQSLPSRERGLKSVLAKIVLSFTKSLPSRERGLKFA